MWGTEDVEQVVAALTTIAKSIKQQQQQEQQQQQQHISNNVGLSPQRLAQLLQIECAAIKATNDCIENNFIPISIGTLIATLGFDRPSDIVACYKTLMSPSK